MKLHVHTFSQKGERIEKEWGKGSRRRGWEEGSGRRGVGGEDGRRK